MAIYSYFLFGGRKQPPVQFDLEQDASAIGLSICLLRDQPELAQVWIIQGREPVAVRIRCEDSDIGMLVDLRAPSASSSADCA
jgi:hypothetical protein